MAPLAGRRMNWHRTTLASLLSLTYNPHVDIHTVLQSVFLGIVQGLTEFIPVSSSAHLDVIPQLLGWTKPDTVFILFAHFGTLLALIFYFRWKLIGYAAACWKWVSARLQHREITQTDRQLTREAALVILATIPAGIVGILLEERIELFYDDPLNSQLSMFLTLSAMIVMGILFLNFHKLTHPRIHELSRIGPVRALVIGLSQCLAFLRGTSRSGVSLIFGQAVGLDRTKAAEFSFLLSIPLIGASSLLAVTKLLSLPPAEQQLLVANALLGITSAAISGYFAVRFMLRYLKAKNLQAFGWYRIVFGVIGLIIILT